MVLKNSFANDFMISAIFGLAGVDWLSLSFADLRQPLFNPKSALTTKASISFAWEFERIGRRHADTFSKRNDVESARLVAKDVIKLVSQLECEIARKQVGKTVGNPLILN
jgi:hypothetical protein